MKFQDEKTQELFDIFFSGYQDYIWAKFESAKEVLYAFTKNRENLDAFIAHVESRIRREGEPCEWEKESIPYIYRDDMKFCPMCGRALEAK